ncbi:MAG: Xre family transcriptional regulator [Paenibacillaceae bacterium]|jgi:transcriptional regulator with XRE-family HTH domain|nr:Xre family transcriptional regulator [Paenibacillaceae bacterium]
MDIRKDFGRRVKALRTRSGVSQECLAERSGLDRTYISSMERGGRNVSLLNIERIAAALHVTVEYLFSSECLPDSFDYIKEEMEGAL